MQRLNICHVTEYLFSAPVSLEPHRLLLHPRESHNIRIESSVLDIFPAHTVQWKRDVLDNSVAVVRFSESTERLLIASNVVIQHYDDNPFDFLIDDYAVNHPFAYLDVEQTDLAPFRQSVYLADQAQVQSWLESLGFVRPIQTFTLLDQMNRAINRQFRYRMREEPGVQSPAFTLACQSGSCRDFATLFMEACRHLGLASRFVSGYLNTPLDDDSQGSTHAWAEVYLPGAGWKGFDPTSGEVTGNKHIASAVARHPEAVPPVSGSYLGPPNLSPILKVSVKVSALA